MAGESDQPFWSRKRIISWLLVAVLAPCGFVFFLCTSKGAARILPSDIERATVPPSSDGTHPCIFLDVATSPVHPQLGRCSNPSDHSGAIDRLEVDLRYGAFVVRQSDFFVEDVFRVPVTRTYFSSDWIDVDRPHSFGHSTSHPYDLEPLGSRRPYTYLNLVFEDGVPLYFGRISSGTDFADAVYMHTDTSTRFYKATIALNGNGWTLHLPDGSSMMFPEAYESRTVAQGAVSQLVDGRGNRLHLDRDQEGLLKAIETPHGRHIRFTYDEMKRGTTLADERSTHVTYRYSEAGMLTDVISTSGSQRHYVYDGTRMTSVSDEHGRILVRNTYQAGVLVRQEYATGEVLQYSYRFARGTSDVEEAVVIFPDLSTQTIRVPAPLRS